MLTSADAIWNSLEVWTDLNHDGHADGFELSSLSSAGVTEMDTRYKRANRRDAHGNLFRFHAPMKIGGATSITYDVFLTEE